MKILANTVLFAGDWGVHKEAARDYCTEHNLTAEDVKIVRRDDTLVCVVAKKDIDFEGG